MGSNSNRSENRKEKIARFAKNIISTREFDSTWQTRTGAEIRGTMGVDKGNTFISDMKKYK